MVSPSSDRISRAPPYSRISKFHTPTGLSPSLVSFSTLFRFLLRYPSAGPISLATTFGVSVDFLSSGYLDVSVRPVRFLNLWIQSRIPLARWVAPFGSPWIKDRSRLPMAFRRVPRPSSPLSAKASARCSCLLDYHCVCIIPYAYLKLNQYLKSLTARPFCLPDAI